MTLETPAPEGFLPARLLMVHQQVGDRLITLPEACPMSMSSLGAMLGLLLLDLDTICPSSDDSEPSLVGLAVGAKRKRRARMAALERSLLD